MIRNYNGYKILAVFMENPTRGFGLRDVCKLTGLGPPSVLNYLKELKNELIVEKRVYGRKLYFANTESRLFRFYKQFHTLLNIEKSELLDFLNEQLNFPTIILFGSKSAGEDTEKSDIDLAVITNSKKHVNLEEYENKLKSKIHLMVLSDKNLEEMKTKNKELFNNIINGKVLSGYLRVV